MQEHATRRLVDVLRAGDELGTRLLDLEVDLDIIHAVASQSIYLVDDDKLDCVLLDEAQHPLQLWSFCRLRTLPRIDKLFDDMRTQRLGLAVAGLTLSRDGESLRFASSRGLISCRDADVDDRPCRSVLILAGLVFVGHVLPLPGACAAVVRPLHHKPLLLPSRRPHRPLAACSWAGDLWFWVYFPGQSGLVEAHADGCFGDTEVICQDGWVLEAVAPGMLESSAWDEGAASEVVGGSFGLFVWGGASVSGVELVSAAVVDNVLELMEEREAFADFGVVLVDADDPLTAVPVAHAADREFLVDDGDARQFSDVLVGDATELEAEGLAHQDVAEADGLAFGQAEGFIEGAGSAGAETAEALENALLLWMIVIHGLCLLSMKRLVVSARSCVL
nr:hypothetical protein [Tessaracoccus aquimaris]